MTNDNDTGGLLRSLGRIEGKQDLILHRIDSQARAQKELEERVADVEKKLNWYAAYIAGAGAVIVIGWNLLKGKIMGAFA